MSGLPFAFCAHHPSLFLSSAAFSPLYRPRSTESPGYWTNLVGHRFSRLCFYSQRHLRFINPEPFRVLTFFGKYVGSVKQNGLQWVNPLCRSKNISLPLYNLNGQTLKVNDKMGNPIEIARWIVWQVKKTTYKAAFDVEGYNQYVQIQSEAAVRHLATSCTYDHMEAENAEITLRDGGGKVNEAAGAGAERKTVCRL